MSKEIKDYLAFTESFLSAEHTDDELVEFKAQLLIRIGFYQHERFVHLIVMALVAVLTIISFCVSFFHAELLILFGLFMILLVPYVCHYYFLENSVQKLYKIFFTKEFYVR